MCRQCTNYCDRKEGWCNEYLHLSVDRGRSGNDADRAEVLVARRHDLHDVLQFPHPAAVLVVARRHHPRHLIVAGEAPGVLKVIAVALLHVERDQPAPQPQQPEREPDGEEKERDPEEPGDGLIAEMHAHHAAPSFAVWSVNVPHLVFRSRVCIERGPGFGIEVASFAVVYPKEEKRRESWTPGQQSTNSIYLYKVKSEIGYCETKNGAMRVSPRRILYLALVFVVGTTCYYMYHIMHHTGGIATPRGSSSSSRRATEAILMNRTARAAAAKAAKAAKAKKRRRKGSISGRPYEVLSEHEHDRSAFTYVLKCNDVWAAWPSRCEWMLVMMLMLMW